MGSSTADNNLLHAKVKRMIMELLKGKETAVQLQTLLEKPLAAVSAVTDEEVADARKLVLQIMRSFSNALSELSLTESARIAGAAVDRGERRKEPPPKPLGLKNRRGCYKRRRSSETWIVKSSSTNDGFAWRKYGQKNILNTEFPRCYYRCTYKYEGCKAIKQVEKIKSGKPSLFQTTYINHHTCTKTSTTGSCDSSHLINFYPSDSVGSRNLISFQTKHGDDNNNLDNPKLCSTISPVKLEDNNTAGNDDQEVPSDTKSSSTPAPPEDLIGLEHNKPDSGDHPPGLEEMGFGRQSPCESTILQYVDDDEFGDDFGNLFCFGNHFYDHVL